MTRRWSGARSMTSAATAACRSSSARCSTAARWCCRAPRSRSATIWSGSGAHGVTHLSGTPSHWRRALMSPSARAMSPRYVRLSGEIADQAILDNLRAFYPRARVGHAYASTEAGVGFEVDDGLRGLSGEHARPAAERRRDEGRGRHAAHPLEPHRRCAMSAASARGARRRGRLRRHRRHRRAARRPLLLRRAQQRRHQCGRPQGASRGGRGGDQPPSATCACRWCARARARSPARWWWPTSCCATSLATAGAGAAARAKSCGCCRDGLTQHKVPAAIRFVPALAVAATGKLARTLLTSCVTSS